MKTKTHLIPPRPPHMCPKINWSVKTPSHRPSINWSCSLGLMGSRLPLIYNISLSSVPGMRQGFLSWRVVYESGYVVINNWLYYFWNCSGPKFFYGHRPVPPTINPTSTFTAPTPRVGQMVRSVRRLIVCFQTVNILKLKIKV